jgi:hypothetical protein
MEEDDEAELISSSTTGSATDGMGSEEVDEAIFDDKEGISAIVYIFGLI